MGNLKNFIGDAIMTKKDYISLKKGDLRESH